MLAGKIFEALTSSPAHKAVHMAALITTKAIWETALEFRFLLFWLALESSFGTEDHRVEITFRLAQRMAFFLEADRIKAKETADLVRRCYNVRSKIVHGYRIAKVSDEEFLSFTEESETLLRRALLSILKSEATMKKFNGGEREEYLDNLTFSNG